MKLISMTDYVLSKKNYWNLSNVERCLTDIFNYANFLKRLLELWMFIPCDEDGNPMEEPYEGMFEIEANTKSSGWAYLYKDSEHTEDCRYYDKEAYLMAREQFQKAKERVLFEGCTIQKMSWGYEVVYEHQIWSTKQGGTIEDLTPYNLTLTKEAINNLK